MSSPAEHETKLTGAVENSCEIVERHVGDLETTVKLTGAVGKGVGELETTVKTYIQKTK